MSEISHKLQDCIDNLCSSGCDSVLDAIQQLERGEIPAGTENLDPADRHRVLLELKAIMAVYDVE
ncbi:MAG: hypothetical protein LJE73_02390 [Proteobacteria bacterium]|jgi:hypothetical protein|nr:hypothetical protein [Pseudomonadota bacterium]